MYIVKKCCHLSLFCITMSCYCARVYVYAHAQYICHVLSFYYLDRDHKNVKIFHVMSHAVKGYRMGVVTTFHAHICA